ncbi:MAG: nucleoside-triphosphatase [Phycisphaerae bacterium]
MNLLLTGPPACGKTTVIVRVAAQRPDAVGFVTEQIRCGRTRIGFAIRNLRGGSGILAKAGLNSRYRVGRYGVDVAAFEAIALPALAAEPRRGQLFLIDEIGKMECFSRRFTERLQQLLDSQADVIATVARHGGGFIARVKQRPDIELIELNRANRQQMPAELLGRLPAPPR